MVLDKLSDSLKGTLQKIARSVTVDKKLINDLTKEIQRALLQSDVNVELVLELTEEIKERAMKEEKAGLTKKEQLINIVYEELVKFLGEEAKEVEVKKKPTKIMLVGLFGSGKTTTAGKLAKFYKKRGYKIALVQTDTYRPAAYEQLKQLSEQVKVDFFGKKKKKDAVKIYKDFKDKEEEYDLVIIDTAGRDALNEELVEELNNLDKEVKADERLLIISADIGQAAKKQAEMFNDSVDLTGVIVTKLDGTAKGGGALTACSVSEASIKFIGTGEKLKELELFDPKRFVSRILGMGDIEGLLEKAEEVIPEEKAEDLKKRMLKGDFTLIDLYEQMKAMKKMGSLGKIMEMIPGFSQMKMPKEMLEVQEGKLEKWKVAMDSMTKEELEEPHVLSQDRMERIAKGSGVSVKTVRELVKQYKQGKKMMKMFKGKNMKQLKRQMKGMDLGQLGQKLK